MKFVTNADQLIIDLTGWEQILGLKNKIIVNRQHITDISFEESFDDWRSFELRIPGTAVPGSIIAGSFWTPEGWDYLYIKRPQGWRRPKATHVLVIQTTLNKYNRVIVSCNHKHAQPILHWFNTTKPAKIQK